MKKGERFWIPLIFMLCLCTAVYFISIADRETREIGFNDPSPALSVSFSDNSADISIFRKEFSLQIPKLGSGFREIGTELISCCISPVVRLAANGIHFLKEWLQ